MRKLRAVGRLVTTRRPYYCRPEIRAGRKGTGRVLWRGSDTPVGDICDELLAGAKRVTKERGYTVLLRDTLYHYDQRVTTPFLGYDGEILWASVLSMTQYGEW